MLSSSAVLIISGFGFITMVMLLITGFVMVFTGKVPTEQWVKDMAMLVGLALIFAYFFINEWIMLSLERTILVLF